MKGRYKAYPEYKDSGVEWIGQIPCHWSLKKLKYLASLITEKADYKSNPIALENIEGWTGKLIETNSIFDGDGVRFKSGDLLFGKLRPYLAKVYLTTKDGEAVGDFHVMRPLTPSYGKYLKSLMLTRDYISTVDASTYGAKMPRASWDFTSNVQLPFCEADEVEKIATFLDHETAKIDTLITKQEKLIELLKEKRQAVISHAVTKGLNPDATMKDSGVEWLGEVPEHWELSKLRFISSFGRGLGITKANLKDTGIPCVSYGEVHSKYSFEVNVDKHPLKCVSEDYLESNPECLLSEGDIIFADTSEDQDSAGNFTQVNGPKYVFAGYHTVVVKFNFELFKRFMAYLFDSESFRNQIRTSVKGVKVFSVTQAILKNSTIWLPPVKEQEAITKHLDCITSKIDQLISHQETLIKLMKERKTALISAAVTGKIDVRDWDSKNHYSQ